MRRVHDPGALPAGPMDGPEGNSLSGGKVTAGALAFCLALSGCTVALHGHQNASGGATTTAAGAAIQAHASSGSAAVRVSFGTPVPAAAPGGHLAASNGAAAALMAGWIIAETLNALSDGSPATTRAGPQRPIAHTCSCYGWRPESDPRTTVEGD